MRIGVNLLNFGPGVSPDSLAGWTQLAETLGLRVTDTKLADDARIAGEGSLDQVRADFEALATLGASYVLLDTYTDDAEATRHHETAWRMLALLAEQALDLPKETLR